MSYILIVEDDNNMLTVLSKAISYFGYDVCTASNGQDGLEQLRAQPEISVMITDLLMPEMDGVELFTRAKALKPDLKGVLCSGHISFQDISQFIAAGFADCLRKPVELDQLKRCLHMLHDKEARWKRRSHGVLRVVHDDKRA